MIGDSCIDRYHFGTVDRISPEAPVPIFKILKTENKNGMSLNVMENLLGLGSAVDIVTSEEEIIKARYIDNKSKQHVIRVDCGEEKRINPLTLEKIREIDFKKYDALIISDYNKGFITHNNVKEILKKQKEFLFLLIPKKQI